MSDGSRCGFGLSVVAALLAGAAQALPTAVAVVTTPAPEMQPLVFATSVAAPELLPRARVLVESLRRFGGRFAAAPVWVYAPPAVVWSGDPGLKALRDLGATVETLVVPEAAAWYPAAGWAFAAASAEEAAHGVFAELVWLGPDTVFLDEPAAMVLPAGAGLGYTPVFHRNVGLAAGDPLDAYWKRAYEVTGADPAKAFAMTTPADGEVIRTYIQAGCLAVRPERGILRAWRKAFTAVASDAQIRAMGEADKPHRVFAFQVALSTSVLAKLRRDEMVELPSTVNYPVFFREMFGGKRDFHDLTGVVTMRYETFFDEPPEGWAQRLTGPPDRIAWLVSTFGPGKKK